MAEYTAIVESGSALVQLLRDCMTPEPISKPDLISLCSPHEPEDNQLTVSLFHMEEDAQNAVPGYVQVSREIQRRAPTVLQLYYIITAHSKAPAKMKEPDQMRMLGRVLQVFAEHPVIDEKYLTGSLKDEGASLRISVQKPSHEQMIKIWNDSANPYKLSVICLLCGVSIDPHAERRVPRVADVAISIEQTGGERQ